MQFTQLGHSSALIEHNGKRLLFDPWFGGSLHWGSWFHFPTPATAVYEVDYIYLSNVIHPETLAAFSREVHVLVPRIPGLRETVLAMGFRRVTAVRHLTLADGFELTSYAALSESAAVVTCRETSGKSTTVVNVNEGAPSLWRRIAKRHPGIDFLWCGHGPARAEYVFEEPADKVADGEIFPRAVAALRPRHAVPFASGYCHLAGDMAHENRNLRLAWDLPIEARYMAPGATWSVDRGFSISGPAPDRAALSTFVARERVERFGELAYLDESLDQRVLKTEVFDKYFRELRARSLPLWWITKACWRFDLESRHGRRSLYFDFNRGLTSMSDPGVPVTAWMTIREGLLADALESGRFANIDTSKRWKVWLARGRVASFELLQTLIRLEEAGYRWNLLRRPIWGLAFRRAKSGPAAALGKPVPKAS